MTSRRTKRLIFFFIAILTGILIGIILGWVILPSNAANTKPQNLRIDYQTDYVLMVAELYQTEGNLDLAEDRLAFIGKDNAIDIVNHAITFGQDHQYAQDDLAAMRSLASDLQTQSSELE